VRPPKSNAGYSLKAALSLLSHVCLARKLLFLCEGAAKCGVKIDQDNGRGCPNGPNEEGEICLVLICDRAECHAEAFSANLCSEHSVLCLLLSGERNSPSGRRPGRTLKRSSERKNASKLNACSQHSQGANFCMRRLPTSTT